MPYTVGLISLGCPKNLVDSEVMLGLLTGGQGGFELTTDPAQADLLVVNTCGFIDKARRESVDAILDMARYKREGRCKALVVSGCLVQAHADALRKDVPEIDGFLGSADYPDVRAVADRLMRRRSPAAPLMQVHQPAYLYDGELPRLLATPGYSAYLKVSEGCDHTCAFCAIPALRGRLRSRSVESCVEEARGLAARGAKELIVISQDTSEYGRDRYGEPRLRQLIEGLGRVQGLAWVRLQYLYPAFLDEALLKAWAEAPNLCRYVDLPLQHADDGMLKAMLRPGTREGSLRLLERLAKALPGAALRSSFIVGYPGESEAAFKRLLSFFREAPLDRIGIFAFSPEAGTPAASLPGQLPAREREARRKEAMAAAARASRRRLARRIGETLQVLVTGAEPAPATKAKGKPLAPARMVGRTQYDAPEIDGLAYFSALPGRSLAPGDLAQVRISGSDDHDLYGEQMA
jgi:ribosomal protein S12 methylthiotransferase